MAVRYMSSSQQLFSREVSKHTWLAVNDLNLSTLFGRAFRVQRPNGVKTVSLPAMQDVSDLLDGIYQLKGGILVRDGTWWKGLAPGDVDTVLTSNGPGQLPSYQAPSAPAGNGMSNLFQLGTSTVVSTTAFAYKGLTFQTDFDLLIGGIWMFGNYVAGQTYKAIAAIASNGSGAGTLSSVSLGPAFVLPETLGPRWQYLPLTIPKAFSAGDLVFFGAGRSDGTGTFVFPLAGFANGAYNMPLPGRPRRLATINVTNPGNGQAYGDAAPGGAVGLGLSLAIT